MYKAGGCRLEDLATRAPSSDPDSGSAAQAVSAVAPGPSNSVLAAAPAPCKVVEIRCDALLTLAREKLSKRNQTHWLWTMQCTLSLLKCGLCGNTDRQRWNMEDQDADWPFHPGKKVPLETSGHLRSPSGSPSMSPRTSPEIEAATKRRFSNMKQLAQDCNPKKYLFKDVETYEDRKYGNTDEVKKKKSRGLTIKPTEK
eukprot:gene14075-4130_t